MSHEQQDTAFLARAVDTRFITTARGEMQSSVLKTIVGMHQSMLSPTDCTDLFSMGGFDPDGGGLAFLIGAVYRRTDDPLNVVLPDANDFLLSKARLQLEVALGGNVSSHYRHQILPPVSLSTAIGSGVSAAMRCWTGLFDNPLTCNFDLNTRGDVTMQLIQGEAVAVSLRFAHDAMTNNDLEVIQDAMVRCVSTGNIANRSYGETLH